MKGSAVKTITINGLKLNTPNILNVYTKTREHVLTAFFPSGGPNTPFLLLSSLDMMMFCVWLALVWAEKLMMLGL